MDGSSSITIPVICGPTASGKTSLAFWLARDASLSIISADSRQLYRRFDIGTAKPSVDEQRLVPHAGIDVLDPVERASAAWWADRADTWIREALDAGRQPLIVGGTGLYLRALFGTLFDEPELDAARRSALRAELAAQPTEELRRWVRALDPVRAVLGRTQLLRAVEIALLAGRRVSDLHREHVRLPRWRARYLVLDPGEELATRIASRTAAMLAGGWREEVAALMRDVPDTAPAWNASGYRAILQLERNEISHADALNTVIIETRQYAKRQRTWFRHQLADASVTRLDPRRADWQSLAQSWWTACDR